jgi:preprotein translocase subunit SecF
MRHALVFQHHFAADLPGGGVLPRHARAALSVEFTGGTVIEVGLCRSGDIGKVRTTVEKLNFGEVQGRTSARRATC